MDDKQYPASQIEAGWQIQAEAQWELVEMATLSARDGQRYMTLITVAGRVVKVSESTPLIARPPEPDKPGSLTDLT